MDVVEPAGADTYVLMSLGGKEVTARLQAETAAQPGMEMKFTFNMEKVYILTLIRASGSIRLRFC